MVQLEIGTVTLEKRISKADTAKQNNPAAAEFVLTACMLDLAGSVSVAAVSCKLK